MLHGSLPPASPRGPCVSPGRPRRRSPRRVSNVDKPQSSPTSPCLPPGPKHAPSGFQKTRTEPRTQRPRDTKWWPSSGSEWRTRSTARTSLSAGTSSSRGGLWRTKASGRGSSRSSSSSSVDQPFSRSSRASGWACNHGNAPPPPFTNSDLHDIPPRLGLKSRPKTLTKRWNILYIRRRKLDSNILRKIVQKFN